jgi:hypothetical protein
MVEAHGRRKQSSMLVSRRGSTHVEGHMGGASALHTVPQTASQHPHPARPYTGWMKVGNAIVRTCDCFRVDEQTNCDLVSVG